jgi:hypothetical protein
MLTARLCGMRLDDRFLGQSVCFFFLREGATNPVLKFAPPGSLGRVFGVPLSQSLIRYYHPTTGAIP